MRRIRGATICVMLMYAAALPACANGGAAGNGPGAASGGETSGAAETGASVGTAGTAAGAAGTSSGAPTSGTASGAFLSGAFSGAPASGTASGAASSGATATGATTGAASGAIGGTGSGSGTGSAVGTGQASGAPPTSGSGSGMPSGATSGASATSGAAASGATSGTATAGSSAQSGASGRDAGSCSPSASTDYCSTIPPLSAPPVIDGMLDVGPTLTTLTPEGWSGAAPLPPFPAGNSASYAVAWRPDGLYVFIAVTTPGAIPANAGAPPYMGAAAEVYVDSTGVYKNAPTYNAPGSMQYIVEAPVPSSSSPGRIAQGYRNATPQGAWTSTQFGTFLTPTGFNFEAFVAAADIGLATWTLAACDRVGLDLAVDVSFPTAAMTGPDGHRVGQYFLHVGAALPYADPRAFCTPTLSDR